MTYITLEQLEMELREHICLGSGLWYIPCMWLIDAKSLINRKGFGL